MKNTKRFFAVVCVLGLVLSLTAVHAMAADIAEPTIFTADDMTVNELRLNAGKDEAEAVFGTPDSTESHTYDATGDSIEVWQYKDLTLTFNELDHLIRVDASGVDYVGPRGVQVGQTPQEVIVVFYIDPQFTTGTVFYTAGYIDAMDAQLPPCGYVQHYDDGSFSVNYVNFTAPLDDIFDNPEDYVFEELAHFQVIFNIDSTVTSFNWSLGPWAE